jgi:hypothetical protein
MSDSNQRLDGSPKVIRRLSSSLGVFSINHEEMLP